MDKTVRMFLVWEEKTDPINTHRFREFPNYDSLNNFLGSLDADNIKSVRIIAGLLMDYRVESIN